MSSISSSSSSSAAHAVAAERAAVPVVSGTNQVISGEDDEVHPIYNREGTAVDLRATVVRLFRLKKVKSASLVREQTKRIQSALKNALLRDAESPQKNIAIAVVGSKGEVVYKKLKELPQFFKEEPDGFVAVTQSDVSKAKDEWQTEQSNSQVVRHSSDESSELHPIYNREGSAIDLHATLVSIFEKKLGSIALPKRKAEIDRVLRDVFLRHAEHTQKNVAVAVMKSTGEVCYKKVKELPDFFKEDPTGVIRVTITDIRDAYATYYESHGQVPTKGSPKKKEPFLNPAAMGATHHQEGDGDAETSSFSYCASGLSSSSSVAAASHSSLYRPTASSHSSQVSSAAAALVAAASTGVESGGRDEVYSSSSSSTSTNSSSSLRMLASANSSSSSSARTGLPLWAPTASSSSLSGVAGSPATSSHADLGNPIQEILVYETQENGNEKLNIVKTILKIFQKYQKDVSIEKIQEELKNAFLQPPKSGQEQEIVKVEKNNHVSLVRRHYLGQYLKDNAGTFVFVEPALMHTAMETWKQFMPSPAPDSTVSSSRSAAARASALTSDVSAVAPGDRSVENVAQEAGGEGESGTLTFYTKRRKLYLNQLKTVEKILKAIGIGTSSDSVREKLKELLVVPLKEGEIDIEVQVEVNNNKQAVKRSALENFFASNPQAVISISHATVSEARKNVKQSSSVFSTSDSVTADALSAEQMTQAASKSPPLKRPKRSQTSRGKQGGYKRRKTLPEALPAVLTQSTSPIASSQGSSSMLSSNSSSGRMQETARGLAFRAPPPGTAWVGTVATGVVPSSQLISHSLGAIAAGQMAQGVRESSLDRQPHYFTQVSSSEVSLPTPSMARALLEPSTPLPLTSGNHLEVERRTSLGAPVLGLGSQNPYVPSSLPPISLSASNSSASALLGVQDDLNPFAPGSLSSASFSVSSSGATSAPSEGDDYPDLLDPSLLDPSFL